jgi:hypothetical protein
MQPDLEKFKTNINVPFEQLSKNMFPAVTAVRQVGNAFEEMKKVRHKCNK